MKRMLLAVGLALCAASCEGQSGAGGTYTFGTIAGTGQLGKTLNMADGYVSIGTYTIAWKNAGTTAAVCSLQPQGSWDGGLTWINTAAPVDCSTQPPSSNAALVIQATPFPLIRVLIPSYTRGDLTTAIIVGLTLGKN